MSPRACNSNIFPNCRFLQALPSMTLGWMHSRRGSPRAASRRGSARLTVATAPASQDRVRATNNNNNSSNNSSRVAQSLVTAAVEAQSRRVWSPPGFCLLRPIRWEFQGLHLVPPVRGPVAEAPPRHNSTCSYSRCCSSRGILKMGMKP